MPAIVSSGAICFATSMGAFGTAFTLATDIVKGLAAGADAFVAKGSGEKDLLRQIEQSRDRVLARQHRVVVADLLDETAVATVTRIGGHQVVERTLLGPTAGQANHHHR